MIENISAHNNKNGPYCENNNKLEAAAFLSESIKEIKEPDSGSENEPDAKKPRLCFETSTVHNSPKKRLNIPKPITPLRDKPIYRYGNYSRYYGYRNTKDFHDVRLDVFLQHKAELFADKDILDIGCNSALLTMSIAKDFAIKHIIGMDIDKSLINRAKKYIQQKRREFNGTDKCGFPFNVSFVHGNCVVRDKVLLEVEERNQFDLILCLSVTKWIHLNFGDAGLKLAFQRIFRQLRPGGKLVLEPQPWNSYKRRKKLTPEIAVVFKGIAFHPKEFTDFLLSTEVGFSEMYELEKPEHDVKGFQRPIQIFVKK